MKNHMLSHDWLVITRFPPFFTIYTQSFQSRKDIRNPQFSIPLVKVGKKYQTLSFLCFKTNYDLVTSLEAARGLPTEQSASPFDESFSSVPILPAKGVMWLLAAAATNPREIRANTVERTSQV